jgi:glycine betaine/proline transport system ATP-binding protein
MPAVTPLPANIDPQDEVDPSQDDADALEPKPGIAAAGAGDVDEADETLPGDPASEGPTDDTMGADR